MKQKKSKTNLKALLNEDLASYYYTGFILADGHIDKNTRLQITLSVKDINYLTNMAKFLDIKNVKINVYNNHEFCHFSAQDCSVIPEFTKKFDIKSDKTHYPPDILVFKRMSNEQFLSLIIGFIDGDGSIKKVYKRTDWDISIKCHSSWLSILELFSTFLLGKNLAKINNKGYAFLCLSNTIITKKMKKFAVENNLPIMQRKWDIIDLDYKSYFEKADENLEKIKKFCKFGKTINEIVKETGLKYSCVYAAIKRNNLQYNKDVRKSHKKRMSDEFQTA